MYSTRLVLISALNGSNLKLEGRSGPLIVFVITTITHRSHATMQTTKSETAEVKGSSSSKVALASPSAFSMAHLSFAEKIMEILDKDLAPDAIWWLPGCKSFCLHSKKFAPLLDTYFQQTKWASFTRKLNQWGFKRIPNKHKNSGVMAFVHPLFQKGAQKLLKGVRYQKKKKNQEAPTRGTGENGDLELDSVAPKNVLDGHREHDWKEKAAPRTTEDLLAGTAGLPLLAIPFASTNSTTSRVATDSGRASILDHMLAGPSLVRNPDGGQSTVAALVEGALQRKRAIEHQRVATAIATEQARQQWIANSLSSSYMQLREQPTSLGLPARLPPIHGRENSQAAKMAQLLLIMQGIQKGGPSLPGLHSNR